MDAASQPLRGRSREIEILNERLHTVSTGAWVVLFEGPPGSGKSRMLSEAHRVGKRHQLGLIHGRGDRTLRRIALSSMLTGASRSGGGNDDLTRPEEADWSYPCHLDWMRARIGERIGTRRLLIVLDDLQWADPITLLALRTLTQEFTDRPVTWVLARRPDAGGGAGELFDRLAVAGAMRLSLKAIETSNLHEIAADILGGATSDRRVAALVDAVDGNPALLAGLLEGFVEDGRVEVRDGVAHLTGPDGTGWNGLSVWACPLPARFQRLVSNLVRELDPDTRHLVEIGAVLGADFVPDDAAEVMGTSAGAQLLAVREGISAGLLTCSADELSFRSEAVRQAVLQNIPSPLRAALHRQYAVVLSERGRPVPEVAIHIARGARPGDRAAIVALRDAAENLVTTSAAIAAELGLRALDLTNEHDPEQVRVAGTAARALVRVGPLAQVVELSEEMVRHAPCGSAAAELRTAAAIAHLLEGRPRRTLAEVCDADLGSEPGRVALSALSHIDPREAERRSRMVMRDQDADPLSRSHARTCLARVRWFAGHLYEGLNLARSAVTPSPVWFDPPLLLVGAMLTHLCEFEEARSVLDTARGQLRADGTTVLQGAPDLVRSQLELAAGSPAAAIAAAEAGLAAAPGCKPVGPAGLARRSLALASLRTGELVAAAAHLENLASGDAEGAWVRVQLAAARPDHPALLYEIRSVCHDPELLRDVVRDDEAAAAWLVRQAAKRSPDDVRAIVDAIEELHLANPRVEVVEAAALHARGLAGRDPDLITRAEETHRDVWSAASAAEDLGRLSENDHRRAVDHLDRALLRYGECEATRDAARVRQRLRRLGVRRRHWRTERRPAMGWNSLTDAERRVAELVASGLTNRQVAQRIYLSPHTVGFHLRQIYRKLEIHSRVELAGQSQVGP